MDKVYIPWNHWLTLRKNIIPEETMNVTVTIDFSNSTIYRGSVELKSKYLKEKYTMMCLEGKYD